MRVLFEVVHPSDVHFYKHIIAHLQNDGHCVLVTARRKDVTVDLLKKLNIPYECISERGEGSLGMARELLGRMCRLFKLARHWKPDVMVARNGGPAIGCVGFLLRIPRIIIEDTEHAKLQRLIGLPFATLILTGDGYMKNHGKRQRTFRGVWTQAYLAPKYFTPQKEPLLQAGVDPEQRYIVLRTVAWDAAHDAGHSGTGEQTLAEMVHRLEHFGRVLISAESPLPDSLKQYANPVAVEHIHDLLAYADLYIGEGGSMAAEAAVLGTPTIYTNALKCGYLNALEKDYGLVFQSDSVEKTLQTAEKILQNPNSKKEFKDKQQKLLEQSDDLVEVVFTFINKA